MSSQPRKRRKSMPTMPSKTSTTTIEPAYSPLDKQTNVLKSEYQDMSNPKRFLITVCMGIVFGFALNRGRVFEPAVIMEQFLFTRWVMMKMFLSAAATSTLCISLMKVLTPRQYVIVREKPMANVLGCVVGGAVLGAGMAVGGMCPGMVLAQVGAGVPNCFISLAALLGGALLYGLVEPFIRSWNSDKTLAYAYADDYFPHRHLLSIALAAVLYALVLVLELLFPWQSELTTPLQPGCTVVTCRAWPPYVAGILVGLLQIPSIAFLATSIGSSSSYVCVAGQCLRLCPKETRTHYKLLASKMTSLWQVVYVTSAVLGSAIAVQLTGTMSAFEMTHRSFDGIQGGTVGQCVVGGLLNIVGSRFAKGCTSGHGISGMGKLSIGSMITVVAMFAGGAIAALLV